jgi:hypothetical protein
MNKHLQPRKEVNRPRVALFVLDLTANRRPDDDPGATAIDNRQKKPKRATTERRREKAKRQHSSRLHFSSHFGATGIAPRRARLEQMKLKHELNCIIRLDPLAQ